MTAPRMTPDDAAALRKPFPESAIGKLQRRNRDGSTVWLDYVGHAATTDRLLSVDPSWNWQPVAFDAEGLPLVRNGNLWIMLTVCGVTRYGVGDGASLKECIGDAIRNAAMRFGVALDLWSKELPEQHDGAVPAPSRGVSAESFANARTGVEGREIPPIEGLHDSGDGEGSPDVSPDDETVSAAPDEPMSAMTRRYLFALFTEHNIPDDEQLPGINHVLDRSGDDAYTSRKQLTERDALVVIGYLRNRPRPEA